MSLLKEKAWDLVSLWVRKSNADENGMVKCITCPTVKHFKEMQAGHFIAGRGNSILFDTRGIAPQCYGCNCMHGGRPLVFLEYLENKLGKLQAIELKDELLRQSRIPYKFSREELSEKIETYKLKLESLETK